jgi:hypothetical protein
MPITADHVAWIVLVVSTFYLLDRLMIWAISRALAAYGRRRAAHASNGAPRDARPSPAGGKDAEGDR